MISRPTAVTAALVAGVAILQLAPAATGIPALTRTVSPRHCTPGPAGFLALTFDDGPHPEGTPAVLRALADLGCSATFFVIGEQCIRYPDLVREMHRQGHEVGVHGWTHAATPLLSPQRTRRDLTRSVDLLTALTGARPYWYRPPYGVASGATLLAARSLWLSPVWWTRWARDWDRHASVDSITAAATARRIRTRSAGGTLLLHDSDTYGRPGSWRLTAAAVPAVVDAFRAAGCTVGSLAAGKSRTA